MGSGLWVNWEWPKPSSNFKGCGCALLINVKVHKRWWGIKGIFSPGEIKSEEYIETSEKYFRPNEVDFLLGDPTKAKEKLGWTPTTSTEDLVKMMVESDLNLAKRESVLIKEGLIKPTWENPI